MIEIHTIFKSRWLSRFLPFILFLLALPLLLARTEATSSSVRSALVLCGETIIPSLFPFMIFSNLTIKLGVADSIGAMLEVPFQKIFGMNGMCVSAVALGALSGFPVGAKTVLEIYRAESCTKEDAERTLAFCNNTGPAFVIAGIGSGFFGCIKSGVALYIIQITAALTVGLLMRGKNPTKARTVYHAPTVLSAEKVTSAITDATTAMLHVCAFVILFAVIADWITALTALLQLPPLLCAGIVGFFEVTCGERMTAAVECEKASFILAAAMLGWSGLSVHMQTMSLTTGSRLSMKRYFAGKLLQSILSALFAWGYTAQISM